VRRLNRRTRAFIETREARSMPRKVYPESTDDGWEPAQITKLGPKRHRSGRKTELNWAGAKTNVDSIIAKDGRPLERDEKGEPVLARALDLIREFFEKNEPKPWPGRPDIYRWLRNHPQNWWG
jgi:hypothetical protein